MENMTKYELDMSDVCQEAFSVYYGSGIEFYEDENGELWCKYPNSERLFCVGNIAAVEEMLMSMGNYGMDVMI